MRGDPRKTFFGLRGCRCRSFRGCVPFLTHASEWRGANGLIVFYAAGDGRGRSPPSPLLSSFTYGRSVCTLSKLNFCRAQGDPSDVRPPVSFRPLSGLLFMPR